MPKIKGEFSKRVIELALSIPSGRVTTYGYLAVCAGGHPILAQMITHILGKCQQVDQIPFHRIVYSDGRVWLGSPKPSEGGLDPKYKKERLKLYKKEGIQLDKNNKIIDFEKIFYSFS